MTSESIEHVLQDYFVATRRVAQSPTARERGEVFCTRIVSVAQHGPLAVALTEVLVRGEPMVDAITLQRDEAGTWRIVDKRFATLEPLASTTSMRLRNEREVRVVHYAVAAPERSIEVFEGNRLVAFTYQIARLDARALPLSHAQAHSAALALLVRVAPDLVGNVALQWIEVHDEGVVRGVKVKMRQSDGRYAWVVVGAGGEPISFERDVIWSNDMGQRMTEQLLL